MCISAFIARCYRGSCLSYLHTTYTLVQWCSLHFTYLTVVYFEAIFSVTFVALVSQPPSLTVCSENRLQNKAFHIYCNLIWLAITYLQNFVHTDLAMKLTFYLERNLNLKTLPYKVYFIFLKRVSFNKSKPGILTCLFK